MDLANRIGLYGSYFYGKAAIGFTLPYLPLLLATKGLSDCAIGLVPTLAAPSGLDQFPVGLWSDRIGWRKPLLVAAPVAAALATLILRGAHGVVWLGSLVVLFAENGVCSAVVESLSGAEAAALACGVDGAALGALQLWKPIGIVMVALLGSWMSERYGVGAILLPLAVAKGLAVAAALLIHETDKEVRPDARVLEVGDGAPPSGWFPKDAGLWVFVAAMGLFHTANAPGGIYLRLFLNMAGFFALATERIAARFSGPLAVLAVTIALSGVLSAFLVNDVVCVALTPLVLHLCRRLGGRRSRTWSAWRRPRTSARSPRSRATRRTSSSARLSHISYLRFAARLAPVAVIGLVLNFAVVALVYRRALGGVGGGPPADDGPRPGSIAAS